MMIAVDDILLFHDALATKLGIPELLFHGFYLLCFLFLIVEMYDPIGHFV